MLRAENDFEVIEELARKVRDDVHGGWAGVRIRVTKTRNRDMNSEFTIRRRILQWQGVPAPCQRKRHHPPESPENDPCLAAQLPSSRSRLPPSFLQRVTARPHRSLAATRRAAASLVATAAASSNQATFPPSRARASGPLVRLVPS